MVMIGKKLLRLCASTLATATILGGAPALAQSASEQSPQDEQGGQLEEIVITARFREERLQDTPLSITAATADQLEAKGVSNVQDLGRLVPNAFITPGSAAVGATPAVALRGVFQSDFNFAFEPGVGIYIDDVYHATLMGSAMDLMDVERVEALRGPQGTLFGKNTLGGAIRLQSKVPNGDDSGTIQLAYGSFNRLDVKGSFDLSLVPDKMFLRVSGVSRNVKGYQNILDFTCDMFKRGTQALAGYGDGYGANGAVVATGSAADLAAAIPSAILQAGSVAQMTQTAQNSSCSLGRAGGQKMSAGRAMLRVIASDALEINLAADYTNDHRDVNPDTLITVINPVLSSRTAPPDFFFSVVRDELLANYGLVYDDRFVPSNPYQTYASNRDFLTGRSNPNTASVESWGVQGKIDYKLADSLKAKLVVAHRQYSSQFSHDSDVSPLGFGLNGNDISHRQTTAEFQLLGQALGGKLDWTLGGFMMDGRDHLGGPIDYVVLHFLQNDTYIDRSRSVFGHAVMHFDDRFSITGGVRYSNNKKTFTFDHIGSGFPTLTQSATTERVDWTVSADYKVTDDQLIYATVATGFRPRSINPRPLTPSQFAPIPGENLISYELGTKGDYFDHRLRVNLAAFYSDYKSHLRQLNGFECVGANPAVGVVFDPALCPAGSSPFTWFYYVGEKAKIYGAEAEITIEPTPDLLINAAFGYNKFESSGQGAAFFDPSNRIQPTYSASAGIQYSFDAFSGKLTPRFDWRYQSLMTYNPAPTTATTPLFNVPANSIFDARLTYELDNKWQASLGVTNLFDKFYYNNKFTLTGFNVSGSPARPREWLFSIKRDF
jgi:iron complex outermembrane receptor protein